MKIRIAFVLLALALASSGRNASADVNVSVSFFYDELSPHGEWVSVRSHGRCWRPARVARDWQPYLNGEWVYTDYGWTWVSDDPWGGDPYHYGTWDRDDDYGWYWIPGTVWAPAWVTWHYSDSMIGWAPVRPSLSLSASGYRGPALTVSRTSYVFVPTTQFVGVNVSTARLPVIQNGTFLSQTRPATRFAPSTAGVLTSGGPTLQQVERFGKRNVTRVSISEAHTRVVPFRQALRGGRGQVIAPAAERARYLSGGRGQAPTERRVEKRDVKADRHEIKAEQRAQKHEQKQERHEQKQEKHEQKQERHEQKQERHEQKHENRVERREPSPQPARREVQAPQEKPVTHEREKHQPHGQPARVEHAAPERHAPAEPPAQARRAEPEGGQPPQGHGNGHPQNQGQGHGQEKEHGKKKDK
ncbi:MAG: DUF6600 domain-containing protein [Thermoanaerobaculia bacterium]